MPPPLGIATPGPSRAPLPEVGLRGSGIHAVTGSEAVRYVLGALEAGRGGALLPATLEALLRAWRDPFFRRVHEEAELRIPDGQVVAWACRLQRTPLPERVSLLDFALELSEAAAGAGRSVFLLGRDAQEVERAAAKLGERFPDLRIAGAEKAPEWVEGDPLGMARVSRRIVAAAPDLVLVGLETPRQELLVRYLRHDRPEAWWVGVGPALRILAGELRAAPQWMQASALDWTHRLRQEPRCLFRPYVVRGLPHGLFLLLRCGLRGMLPKGKPAGVYGRRPPRALLVDDDRHALDHLELLLTSRFPALEVESRTRPDVSGAFDFYFLDNDFSGDRLAARLAQRVRAERPSATIIAFSGLLDAETLRRLINLGCDGVCDKAEPQSWRPILELVNRRLEAMAERHRADHSTFGGLRAAYALRSLLHEWNRRDAEARREPTA